MVTVRDLGVPVTGAPDGVLSLLEIGVATAADARSDGASNVTKVRFGLPAHHRIVDTDGLQIVSEAWEPSADVVMLRPMVPGDAASLTRIIYRATAGHTRTRISTTPSASRLHSNQGSELGR